MSRAHWFTRLAPESWRRAHRRYAVTFGYFWLPCALCGHEFGGHEWRDINGYSSVVHIGSAIHGRGICPACTRAGRGDNATPLPTQGA